MSGEEFRARIAELEAKANMAYGAYVNRRSGNGGRYWALGAVIAAMSSENQRRIIEVWLHQETESLEAEFYAQAD